jgi:hypothetical protein
MQINKKYRSDGKDSKKIVEKCERSCLNKVYSKHAGKND